MARLWAMSGAVAGTGLPALGSGLQFVIPAGFEAFIQGFYYRNDSTSLTKTASANGSTLPRLDQLVLRLDRDANSITSHIKQGTPAASPLLPSLSTNLGGIWEIPLVYATCPGSGSAQNYTTWAWNGPWTEHSFQLGGSNVRPAIKADLQRSDGSMLLNSAGGTDLRVWSPVARKHRTPAEGAWTTNYAGRGLSHPRHGRWGVYGYLPTGLASSRYIELQIKQDNTTQADDDLILAVDTSPTGFGAAVGYTELWVPETEQLRLLFGAYNSAAQADIRAGAHVRVTWLGYE